MHRAILVAALLTAGCTTDPAVAFVGLWAGTYIATETDRATGETFTYEPMPSSVRIRQDTDGLYLDTDACDIPLRATSTTHLRVLPVSCDTSAGRFDFLDGDGTLRATGILTLEMSGTFRDSGSGSVFDVNLVHTLERTD